MNGAEAIGKRYGVSLWQAGGDATMERLPGDCWPVVSSTVAI